MKNAFEEGYQAASAYDNPYWKNYPNKAADEEVIKARMWVDGYVKKLLQNKNYGMRYTFVR